MSWVERERRTAALVRACYERCLKGKAPDAEMIHALCKLTWITKGKGKVAENTRSVVVPALTTLLDLELSARDPRELGAELREIAVDDHVATPASGAIGFVNFYLGFRNTSLDWLEEHLAAVWPIVTAVAEARTDTEVRRAYAAVDALPPLPRPNAGDMPCYNLLTPMLACLDVRKRTPVINGREEVVGRLSMLGLSHATLEEQCVGLQGLIGQAGIEDAFALDTVNYQTIGRAIAAVELTAEPDPDAEEESADDEHVPASAPLAERRDDDVEYLRGTDPVQMAHRHHTMTNALRTICARAKLRVEEGTNSSCLFDALIREYDDRKRHLLVEVKTDDSPPLCRLAVGQLHDYRRKLPGAAAIDLAVLLPSKPQKDMLDFLGYVGVRALWLDQSATHIEGDVPIGGE